MGSLFYPVFPRGFPLGQHCQPHAKGFPKMKITVGLVILFVVAYVLGAKFPGPVSRFWPGG
jgi:hypothetical protein